MSVEAHRQLGNLQMLGLQGSAVLFLVTGMQETVVKITNRKNNLNWDIVDSDIQCSKSKTKISLVHSFIITL